VDASHRLAGAAVRHDAGETLQSIVEADELFTPSVVDNELGVLHRIVLDTPRTVHQRRAWRLFAAQLASAPSLLGLIGNPSRFAKGWITRFRDLGAQVGPSRRVIRPAGDHFLRQQNSASGIAFAARPVAERSLSGRGLLRST
jgi:hypothetical protein